MATVVVSPNPTPLPFSSAILFPKPLEEISAVEALFLVGKEHFTNQFEIHFQPTTLDNLEDDFELQQLTRLSLKQDKQGRIIGLSGVLPSGKIEFNVDGEKTEDIPPYYRNVSASKFLNINIMVTIYKKQNPQEMQTSTSTTSTASTSSSSSPSPSSYTVLPGPTMENMNKNKKKEEVTEEKDTSNPPPAKRPRLEKKPTSSSNLDKKSGDPYFKATTLSGGSFIVYLPSPKCTVRDAKVYIQDIGGFPPETQRLILRGRQLQDDETMEELSISPSSSEEEGAKLPVVHLIRRNWTPKRPPPPPSSSSSSTSELRYSFGPVRLQIKELSGQVYTFQFPSPKSTIRAVKEQLQLLRGLPVDQQRLIFAGSQLEDSSTLEELGLHEIPPSLEDLPMLHLVLRLRGGMYHVTSGRVDFISLLGKKTESQKPSKTFRVGCFNHSTPYRTQDFVTIETGPGSKASDALKLLKAEFDPFFWETCSDADLLELPFEKLSSESRARLLSVLSERGRDTGRSQGKTVKGKRRSHN